MPARIISLVPAVTEMLFAVGAGQQVIAVSSFDHFPPEVKNLPRVGALVDPDIERILALRPDLVAVFEGQDELREKLWQAHIEVFTYRRAKVGEGGLADVPGLMRELGRITGHHREAAAAADQLQSQLRAIEGASRRDDAGNDVQAPRVMLVIGREPGALRNIYVSGGVGYLADMLAMVGGRNVFGDVKRENLQVTTEAILAAQPDVILEVVASRPWTAEDIAREEQVWDHLSSVPAVRLRRVRVLVGDEYVIPGPRVAQAARQLAEAIRGLSPTGHLVSSEPRSSLPAHQLLNSEF